MNMNAALWTFCAVALLLGLYRAYVAAWNGEWQAEMRTIIRKEHPRRVGNEGFYRFAYTVVVLTVFLSGMLWPLELLKRLMGGRK